jgi:hypothetical protein
MSEYFFGHHAFLSHALTSRNFFLECLIVFKKDINCIGFSFIIWYAFINSSFMSDRNDFSLCKLKNTAHHHKKGSK